MSDAISDDDMWIEINSFGVEGFRAWRSIDLTHREIDRLSFRLLFYFSVRTGTPYLECRDGLFRPCPQELTDALELSPKLPVIRTMMEDDPKLTLWLDEISAKYFAEEGISSNELERACGEDQLLRDLEFRIDVYSPEDDGWPLYCLKGYFHPQTGTPYLMFRDDRLREMSQETADSLGLSTALQKQKETLPYFIIRIIKGVIAMKKTDPIYVLVWYGLPIILAAALAVVGTHIRSAPTFLLALVLLVVTPIAVPGLLKKRMEKCAAELEREFPNISYKFTAHNCVIYLDTEGGHMGVVWRNNPSQLQSIDPMQITNIRTNTGQKLRRHRTGELPIPAQ